MSVLQTKKRDRDVEAEPQSAKRKSMGAATGSILPSQIRVSSRDPTFVSPTKVLPFPLFRSILWLGYGGALTSDLSKKPSSDVNNPPCGFPVGHNDGPILIISR